MDVRFVRVNAMETPHFGADIAEMVRDGVHLINLPKPETVQQVREVAQRIAEAADANGVAQVPGLLLNIETPRALRCAAELASAHASVAGLQMGLGDQSRPCWPWRAACSTWAGPGNFTMPIASLPAAPFARN